MRYVSRALCPIPHNTISAGNDSVPLIVTPVIRLFSVIISVTCAPKRTSPPQAIICSRIAFTMCRKISVPTCGLCLYKISSGAPNSTKYVAISCKRGCVTRVVNFPSENVPAPPSPNCTLDSGLKIPCFQKASTSNVR